MKLFLLAAAVGMLGAIPLAHAQNCASAVTLASNQTYVSDTTGTTDWMFQFGPLASPSRDMLYTFTAGAPPLGTITPTVSSYLFAMYLIPSCSDTGSEPVPIRATSTLGTGIDLNGLTEGVRYYLAITGTAAGGPGANGTLTFDTPFPVMLQSFTVD